MFDIGGRKVGGEHFALIAGPCTVETRDQTLEAAHAVGAAGATMFRGGAYKPRTSPYAFQGLGEGGLRILAEAKARDRAADRHRADGHRASSTPVLEVADVIQIGARNMQNYTLLTELGRAGRPVLLKRGLSATLEELLMAAEYILKEGNPHVMLCERGIRTFETAYRFTLDLTAVPVLKELTHLPVIVDPSHAAGRRELVEPLSLAAAAVGADGIIVEVHPNPDRGHLRRPAAALRRPVRRLRGARGAGGGRRRQELLAGRRRLTGAARGRRRRPDRRVRRAGGARARRRARHGLGPRRRRAGHGARARGARRAGGDARPTRWPAPTSWSSPRRSARLRGGGPRRPGGRAGRGAS